MWSHFYDQDEDNRNQEILKKRILIGTIATMMLTNIDDILPKDIDLVTLNMDASDKPPTPKTPYSGASTALPYENFTATKAISEAASTTPEGITKCITAMLSTFKHVLVNQAKQRILSLSMMDLIVLMAMDEKSTRVQIIHLITASRSTNKDFKDQAVGFRGKLIMNQ